MDNKVDTMRRSRRWYVRGRNAWSRFRIALRGRHPDPDLHLVSLVRSRRPSTQTLTINCVVFSKDRAMQLDACVRSINDKAPYDGRIKVIYLATTQPTSAGYLALERADRVDLVPQSDDFRRDVLDSVDPKRPYTVFHTDDDVFFREPPEMPHLAEDSASFSLRLGKNTTYCYPLDRNQRVPVTFEDGPVISWDWTKAEADFAYPLSLNGHIFETAFIRQLLSRSRFSNPNELEESLHIRRHLAPRKMLAFQHSCVVSIPANIVAQTHANRHAATPRHSAVQLNERFLGGEAIDIDRLDFSRVNAAHCEIPLLFTRRDSPKRIR
jgi:hypothetical protein